MTIEQQLIEKGKKEGIKEGEKVGEHKKAIETAKKMKTDGLDIEHIIKYTGLSEEEIRKL
jgi:predicted transposase/invertase (TIGR01784 family)